MSATRPPAGAEPALGQVLDALDVGVLVHTPAGLQPNRHAQAVLGLGRNGTVAPDEIAVHTETGEPIAAWVEQSAASDAGLRAIVRRPDGSTVAVLLRTRTAGRPGAGAVTLLVDRDEDLRMQRQLVEGGRMAALGELVTGLAHELNNPLFAILGLLEFLLKDAEPGTKAHDRLLLIQQSGEEIREIVRALLDFGREPTEGFCVVDLREVAGSAVELLRRTNADRGLELREAYADEPVPVRAVPNQLKQLLLNLVSNARVAMSGEGTATVAIARDGDTALLSVSDQGPGVPEHLHGRIFEPFFSTRRDSGATGLGLSACHGIASLHGGALSIENLEDGGACFRLRLPLAQGPS